MTPDSQFALRRIIEQYSKVTRFCIICNYHNKIINPIISRCSFLRFKAIKSEDILLKLKQICIIEKFNCNDIILNKIINICRGDLRKAINLLQKCYNSYGDKFNSDILDEISGVIPSVMFNQLMQYIFKKDIKNIDIMIEDISLKGYSIVNQILLFHNYIINSELTSIQKSKILCMIAEIESKFNKWL
jgi:replication factor C subunit 2/4